ncbi:hypothetical protein N9N28_04245 [Rubripirellula amarantea]|nr:hypothetical protein [Rubripirellula amarantea]
MLSRTQRPHLLATSRHLLCAAMIVSTLCLASPATSVSAEEAAPMGPLNPMNWKMPEFKMPSFKALLPGEEEKTRIKTKKDGLFSEVTQTASNSWNRTKEALNPQKLNPTRFFTASSKTPSTETEETKPGFFQSLFMGPAETKEPETVTDFLRQDRVNP